MAWPAGVTLRTCSFGPDFGIVSGDDYGCDIVVSVSRPMMTWGATGSGGIGDQDSLSFTPGQEVTFQLPVTDQAGWYIGGLPIDVSDGKQSHVYTLTIKPWIYNSLGRKTFSNATLTLSNLAVPTGDDTLDLDKSVATSGAQGGTVTIPDLVGQLQASVETSATDAAASASAAAASAQTAHDISNIDTSDDVVSTLVADPQTGPKTTAALGASIATGAVAVTDSPTAVGNSLTKYGVIIDLGGAGDFDDWRVESLTAFLDPVSGRLAGVYTGYQEWGAGDNDQTGSIGLAWSDNGYVWTKQGQFLAPTGVAGDPDQYGCTGCSFAGYDGTGYHFNYIGLTQPGYEGGTKRILHASTPSLTDPVWTRHGVMIEPAGDGWRALAVYHRSIVQRGDLFYMFFNAAGSDSRETIGYATGPTRLGPWTVDDVNSPVVQPKAGWRIAGDPVVTRIPGGWRMDYFQYDSASFAADYYATTSDEAFPLGWVPGNSGNPILVPSEDYDALFAHKPALLRLGGRVYHYYTAVTTGIQRRTIALATEPPIRADMSAPVRVTGINQAAWLSSFIDSLAVFGYPPMVPPGVLVKDTFSTVFGTADTGQSWTPVNGTLSTERGILHGDTLGGDNAIAVIDAGQSAITVDVDLTSQMPGTATSIAAIIRYVDPSNFWEARVDESTKTTLVVWIDGAIADIPANVDTSWVAGDHLSVVDDGATITVYRNGIQVATAASTVHAEGTQAGMLWRSQLATEVDNFTLTATA